MVKYLEDINLKYCINLDNFITYAPKHCPLFYHLTPANTVPYFETLTIRIRFHGGL